MARIVFLHGLESHIGPDGVPAGRKATWLRAHHDAATPALDTRAAIAIREAGRPWSAEDYERAFAVPLARARAAIGPDTRLVIGSSFGGAVLMRLLHEAPRWSGPALFLAGAGVKLTPYRELPPGQRILLVHGAQDDVVPFADSERLAATSDAAELWRLEDGHRLASITEDGTLQRAIARCLG